VPESDDNLRLEIGHVLFIDIVGYSKLLNEEQKERLNQLIDIVLATAPVREAPDEQLVRLPTGDGMALVFRRSAEEPARCALEIAEALQKHPKFPVRMGIHSGPVSEVTDVSGRTNIAGAGINMAQRVMDCGDAGHILLSQHVADDLIHSRQWASRLRDLGECEVKHGVRIGLVNLYSDDFGNPALPEKLRAQAKARARRYWVVGIATLLLLAAVAAGMLFVRSRNAPAIPDKSIAVLPFENLSANQENAFFADGVQGEILTDLAKVADLKVISQTSVMQYRNAQKRNLREIARALGVSHILEGSVQRAGDKVRVNAQLIDARNDTHMWAEKYDRALADVFAIQSEIAQTIANQLQARLSPREETVMHRKPTTDMAAYDLYLQAKEIRRNLSTSSGSGGVESVQQAIRLLEDALKRDPNFVPALCLLVESHLYLHWVGSNPTAGHLELARSALERAARLEPDSGEVHLMRALFYYQGSRNYAAALEELAVARASLPNSPEVPYYTAIIERRQNKWDISTRHLQEALQLDPRNVQYISELAGSNYWATRKYADAIKILDETMRWKPNDFGLAFLRASIYYAWKADLAPWRDLVAGEISKTADPNDLITARLNLALKERDYHAAEQILAAPGGSEFDDDGFFTPREFNQGIVARALGDMTRAKLAFAAARERSAAAVRQRPDDPKRLIALGECDAAVGRKDDAIAEGERATQLLPVEKDMLNGTQLLVKLSEIYAQAGEIGRALDLLEKVVQNHDGSNYGSLKLDWVWDPLRGNPRFEKIVESLAPK
jgi:serine/threonine-protein kinase